MAKDAHGHGSDSRGAGRMPIAGHPYHQKTNDELRYIQKDAYAAAQAMQGHNDQAENKYRDQINDASTVLGYRDRGGADLSNSGAAHTQAIADQHGVGTEHLNAQGHAWGSPEALRDFKSTYGGPRDHAAEQRSFSSGAREINRLRGQGK